MQNYMLLLITGVAVFIAGILLRKSSFGSSIYLAVLALLVTLWSLFILLFELQLFYLPSLVFISGSYLFSTVAATSFFIFSLAYSNRSNWISKSTLLLLAVEPLGTQILFWVEPARELFFMEKISHIASISLDSGVWANVNMIYLYSFEIAGLLLIMDIYSKKQYPLSVKSLPFLAGAFAPFMFRIVNIVDHSTISFFDHSINAYSIAIIGLALGLLWHQTVKIESVTSETVVKAMSDGWMVLDLNSNIIDVNPAAEKIVGIPHHFLYGRPIRSILPDWPDISNIAGEGKELEMRRSVRTLDSWRYLNVRLSNLRDRDGVVFGQLIIWRDITERKLVEDARQRARDEIFVLLNAISNAASHSITLEDFLSESVYQIIYPFQSQLAAIFLIEDDDEKYRRRQFRMAAHFGLAPDSVRGAGDFAAYFNEVMFTKQPLVVDNIQENSEIPNFLKDTDVTSLIVLPLFTQAGENSRTLGALLLGRKDKNMPYSQVEIIRLTAIAEQIGNLIDSDRRRQLAIALSEREKIMRDLHDSVSQKLYGLVTLTEAAQAGLDAGSKVVPSQVLSKIGENARQAVKEMRLFLYQMQPIDLEQGDLISALHHRLGAVEGRADIQARFMPDEGVSISKDKEIAFYYIAQEALNNILKHARANSVLVKLRQTKKYVILEIIDNGVGFEPKNVDQNGIGLQNMKSRMAQVHGEMKIISKPGSGTTIKAMLPLERVFKKSRNR